MDNNSEIVSKNENTFLVSEGSKGKALENGTNLSGRVLCSARRGPLVMGNITA